MFFKVIFMLKFWRNDLLTIDIYIYFLFLQNHDPVKSDGIVYELFCVFSHIQDSISYFYSTVVHCFLMALGKFLI